MPSLSPGRSSHHRDPTADEWVARRERDAVQSARNPTCGRLTVTSGVTGERVTTVNRVGGPLSCYFCTFVIRSSRAQCSAMETRQVRGIGRRDRLAVPRVKSGLARKRRFAVGCGRTGGVHFARATDPARFTLDDLHLCTWKFARSFLPRLACRTSHPPRPDIAFSREYF